ncbi:MAG: hypothetical protein H6669_06960 [Ardenticatenaceae bacterium]|nr:hypothetical protein [Ardenticatenaceae bacterium]
MVAPIAWSLPRIYLFDLENHGVDQAGVGHPGEENQGNHDGIDVQLEQQFLGGGQFDGQAKWVNQGEKMARIQHPNGGDGREGQEGIGDAHGQLLTHPLKRNR